MAILIAGLSLFRGVHALAMMRARRADLIAVVAGLLLYAPTIVRLHPVLFGVPALA